MNTLEKLFKSLEKKKIPYCVRGRYKHLPKTLDGGDVDLLIEKRSFNEALKVLKTLGFHFYPHTKPNLFFYHHDNSIGLIQLDIILTKKFPKTKKYKSFFIPADGKTIPNRKPKIKRLQTGIQRRLHWFLRGPIIVFEGPDGSGKTTNSKALLNS